MGEFRNWLNFCGVRMGVQANRSDAVDGFCDRFPAFSDRPISSVTDNGSEHLMVNFLESERIDPASNLPMTWSGKMPSGHEATIYESETATDLIVENRIAIRFEHDRGAVNATYPPGKLEDVLFSAAYLIVGAALERAGHVLIHAATLIERASGKAILLAVPSGGGKTTTSLALARNGYDLVTDDASILAPTSRECTPQVWGLPRPLKVHQNTARLMPWIAPLSEDWNSENEQAVPLESISDQIGIVTVPRPTDLAAIIILGARSPDDHRLERLAKNDALIALAGDNVAWRPAGMTERAGQRFDRISDMVAATPTYLLSAGGDVASLPALFSSRLAGIFEKAPTGTKHRK